MSEATLEEFIKNYIQNKAISQTKEGYADWLMKNGVNAEKIYSDSLSSINADYARSVSEYGTNAERLHALGLSGSGYSDYLSGKAYSTMQAQKQRAREEYGESSQKNLAGYADYIAKINESTESKLKTAIKEITSMGLIDYDAAYDYAVTLGLSEDDAKAAAKSASDTSRKALKDSIMKTILTRTLTESQAYNYALALGLNEEEAKELSEYAKSINQYVDFSSSKIIDEIKNQINNKAK